MAIRTPFGDILGVIGGMGPAATVDFLAKLTLFNPVASDQQHVPSVVCNVPDIPDRTEAILANGPSPLPAMLVCLELLEHCGVSCVAIPCNTAHFWFADLQRSTPLTIIHIVDAVRTVLEARGALRDPVGLLATTATIQAGIYSRLAGSGVDCIVPDGTDQDSVMRVIRRVKAGVGQHENQRDLSSAIRNLRRQGARQIILGCTELPLAAPPDDSELVDSTAALALACIQRFRRPLRTRASLTRGLL